jgi:hypothetical protein
MAKKKGKRKKKVITYHCHCRHAIQLPNLYAQVSDDGRSRRRTMDRQRQGQRLRQSPSQAEKTTWLIKKGEGEKKAQRDQVRTGIQTPKSPERERFDRVFSFGLRRRFRVLALVLVLCFDFGSGPDYGEGSRLNKC